VIGTVLSLASSIHRAGHGRPCRQSSGFDSAGRWVLWWLSSWPPRLQTYSHMLPSDHRRTAAAINYVPGGTRAASRADPGSAKRETV